MNNLKYYKRNGYEFQIVQRNGDVCRAVGRKGKIETHEVFIVQHNPERVMGGKNISASESPPGNEQWGRKGWTYTGENQAIEKFAELVGDICPKCHDQRMMPSDDPNGDVMNTPCPLCNENSPDYGKQQ